VSPTGPLYAGAATAGTDWTNVSNAVGAADGNSAFDGNIGPGGGGNHSPSALSTSAHGFNLPVGAVIDGIELEALVSSGFSFDQSISIGTSTKGSTSTPGIGQPWNGGWNIYGSSTSLWGQTWTAADINSSSFGATLLAYPSHSTDNISIDSVRITVWWHSAPADVPKRYEAKVYNNGQYLGNVPTPVLDFSYSHEINTAGAQITIQVPFSIDTAYLPSQGALTDESGATLTDETGSPLYSDGAVNLVSLGTGSALIKSGNQVIVWEYGYYYPNGHIVFRGTIERWEASFGGDSQDESINILCYSDGSDLDNFMLLGAPFVYTVDQSQTAQNASATIYNSTADKGFGYNYYGQSFTIGSGVTNLGGIYLLLNGSANVTLQVFSAATSTTPLASVTVAVGTAGAQQVLLGLANHLIVTPGQTLFFAATVDAGQSITIYYDTANPYSGGVMYQANYGGGSGGGGLGAITGSDLYFQTASSNGQTVATYSNQDPTTGMLAGFMADYRSRGGNVVYNSSSIQATGLSLTYQFNTNTIYEGIQAILSVAPYGFYYYVDLATDTLYFKQASTTPDVLITKGKNISKVTIIATIENIFNLVYFSGGVASGGTTNLYANYQSPTSIALYGPKLERLSDNRVTDQGTADAIGNSAVQESSVEQYQTTVTVLDKTMDISLLRPGQIVGFRGFGTFVDTILSQIVRVDRTPDYATLTLGVLPPRLDLSLESITRGLIAQETIDNPATPS
jgi:hypothetical protein